MKSAKNDRSAVLHEQPSKTKLKICLGLYQLLIALAVGLSILYFVGDFLYYCIEEYGWRETLTMLVYPSPSNSTGSAVGKAMSVVFPIICLIGITWSAVTFVGAMDLLRHGKIGFCTKFSLITQGLILLLIIFVG